MTDKLRAAEDRFISVEDSLADPDVMSDTAKYASLMKEYKNLSPIIEK